MSFYACILSRNGQNAENYISLHRNFDDNSTPSSILIDSCFVARTSDKHSFIYTDPESTFTIVGDINIANSEELSQVLHVSNARGFLSIVLDAYKKWREKCVNYLLGEFSFVVFNHADRTLFCARDQIGLVPFFYFLSDDVFIFGNSVNLFHSFNFPFYLSKKALVRYLHQRNQDKHKTFFVGIYRLPPAHVLSIEKSKITQYEYWSLSRHINDTICDVTYIDASNTLMEKLRGAVNKRLNNVQRFGVELTSGIDSSGVTALAQQHLLKFDQSLIAFTNVLPPSKRHLFNNFTDEWRNASKLSDLLRLRDHVPIDYLTYRPSELLQKSIDLIGYPLNNYFTIHQHSLYTEVQKRQINVLLSGFGGNEVVTEYAIFNYENDLLQGKRLWKLQQMYRDRGDNPFKSTARTVRNAIAYYIPMDWSQKGRNKIIQEEWKLVILHDSLIKGEIIEDEFVSDLFEPTFLRLREKTIFRLSNENLIERLEGGYFFSAYYNFKYSYPLLDVSLLLYYFCIRDAYKAKDQLGRGLYRSAMAETLPDWILQRPKLSNTKTIPVLKLYYEDHFQELRSACLDVSPQHEIYSLVDRKKLEKLSLVKNEEIFSLLEHFLLAVLFIDHSKGIPLYDA